MKGPAPSVVRHRPTFGQAGFRGQCPGVKPDQPFVYPGNGKGVLKGVGLIAKLKGIKTEDQMIKNKELYFQGSSLNPACTPLGRTYDRSNPWELYFGKRAGKGMPEGTQTVFVAMQQGYEVEQLEVVTGLNPQQLARSIQYLKEKKLWAEDWG